MKQVCVIFVVVYCTVFNIFYNVISCLLYEFMILKFGIRSSMDLGLINKGSCESFGVARKICFFEVFWYILIRDFMEMMSVCVLSFVKFVRSAVFLLIIFLPNILLAFRIPTFDKVNFRTYPVIVNLSTASIIVLLLYSFAKSSSVVLSSFGGEWKFAIILTSITFTFVSSLSTT